MTRTTINSSIRSQQPEVDPLAGGRAASRPKPASAWSIDDSIATYGIAEWGAHYFSVNEHGEICANINRKSADCRLTGQASDTESSISVPLIDIVAGLEERGHAMPVLLRIENILDQRICDINESFSSAMQKFDYQGAYRGVFPIKVNQQCHVIEEITKFGGQYHHGLEAGSKAELIIALSHLTDPEAVIVCNGYKDIEFIHLGLNALKLGSKCFFVVETPAEIQLIIEQSRALNIEPLIGVRVKLSHKVEGHWYSDSGERSLFGLSTMQLTDVIDTLKAENMLHCLQLVHCHIGSQIPNIRNIRSGVQEACRYYVELKKEGAPLGYLDLGGGLAVDYTGTQTNETHSKNYSLREYCEDLIEGVTEAMSEACLEHPTIITESGRATVAYSSMLLFNILDVSHFRPISPPVELPSGCDDLTVNIWQTRQAINKHNIQESCNDAVHYRDGLRNMFQLGQLSLREFSIVENIYYEILQYARKIIPSLKRVPAELQNLNESLADIYYGNFSLFQSLPDAWAIDQIFPVVPLHRLHEEPKNYSIIADITCDSDGKLDLFSNADGHHRTIPLHNIVDDEEYYLGAFLVGAYQETLGDLHNLFGDTNVASVRLYDTGSFEFVEEIEGDSIGDVLSYVEYNPKEIYENLRLKAEAAVKSGDISVTQRRAMLKLFRNSIDGYTYLERDAN